MKKFTTKICSIIIVIAMIIPFVSNIVEAASIKYSPIGNIAHLGYITIDGNNVFCGSYGGNLYTGMSDVKSHKDIHKLSSSYEWVIDNMYVPFKNASSDYSSKKDQYLMNIKYKCGISLSLAQMKKITDHEWFLIDQYLIWQFSKNNTGRVGNTRPQPPISGNAKTVYDAMKNVATEEYSKYNYSDKKVSIEDSGDSSDIQKKSSGVVVEGISIKNNTDGFILSGVTAKVAGTAVDKSKIKLYKDSKCSQEITKIESGSDYYGVDKGTKKIYVKIDKMPTDGQQVEVTLNAIAINTSGYYYETTWGNVPQPLISVQKNIEDVKKTVTREYQNQSYVIAIEKINSRSGEGISGVEFKYKKNSGAVQTITTGNTGRKMLGNGNLEEGNIDTYTITEVNAGDKYYKLAENQSIVVHVKYTSEGIKCYLDDDETKKSKKLNLDGAGDQTVLVSLDHDVGDVMCTVKIQNLEKVFDVALRKVIVKVDEDESYKDLNSENYRQAKFNVTDAAANSRGTINYNNKKNPVETEKNKKVVYEIQLFNEGTKPGRIEQITDYLPTGLKLAENSEINGNNWTVVNGNEGIIQWNGNIAMDHPLYNGQELAKYLANHEVTDKYVLIDTLKDDHLCETVKVECEVTGDAYGYLTNVAEITKYYDSVTGGTEAKTKGVDRDSEEENVFDKKSTAMTTRQEVDQFIKDYRNEHPVDDSTYKYYLGNQDDDDFETIYVNGEGSYSINLEKVDKANKNKKVEGMKFKINDQEKTTDAQGKINIAENVTINKDNVENVDEYTIEENGTVDKYIGIPGKFKVSVEKSLPDNNYVVSDVNISAEGAKEFKEDSESTNKDYYKTYQMLDDEGNVVNMYLKLDQNNISIVLENQDKETPPDKIYDLSLRKFITKVNDNELTGEKSREPQVDVSKLKSGESTTATYNHTKEPVIVATNQIVTYKIRVYNEGPTDAYASIIKDDIPDGLEFISYKAGDGSVNEKYGWKLVDANDNEVKDPAEARYIVTNYLDKDSAGKNLLKGFDPETMNELDYRDVEVQFKVTEPNTSDRIITNYAQITKETDNGGTPVKDRDSVPNVWNEGEDDQDIEKIKVLYFDLALRKWVTQAIVTENGQTKIVKTGHKAEDDPEEVVKVDLKKSKMNEVVVKFRYSIRITNQGEIAGEAQEISDYIPEGLKFVQEDNPDWKVVDGKVTTDKLKGHTLQPGESAEVEIVLTWVNSDKNMGVMVNTAEISKDYNDYGAPDIDSTPNNKVPGEDDIDDAPVMLTIKTGALDVVKGSMIALGSIALISTGVVIIKKNVLSNM